MDRKQETEAALDLDCSSRQLLSLFFRCCLHISSWRRGHFCWRLPSQWGREYHVTPLSSLVSFPSPFSRCSRQETNFRLFGYVPTAEVDVPWSFLKCSLSAQSKAIVKTDSKRLHIITNPRHQNFAPAEYGKYLFDPETGDFYDFSDELWLGGLVTAVPKTNAYAAGLPAVTGSRCPHFIPESFAAQTHEHALLNNFRTQCHYCCDRKKRSRSAVSTP